MLEISVLCCRRGFVFLLYISLHIVAVNIHFMFGHVGGCGMRDELHTITKYDCYENLTLSKKNASRQYHCNNILEESLSFVTELYAAYVALCQE